MERGLIEIDPRNNDIKSLFLGFGINSHAIIACLITQIKGTRVVIAPPRELSHGLNADFSSCLGIN